jgi:hypothetical protein
MRLYRLTVVACFLSYAFVAPSSAAQKDKTSQERSSLPASLMSASSAAIDCDACPRALAKAGITTQQMLLSWNRFRILEDRKKADVVFLLSGNPYLGDYLTRDGPDTRPVFIDGVILTVIDARTGQALWTDSRKWGSWRVVGATKDLMEELRTEIESQVKRWTFDEIFRCNGTPPYQSFAFATPEEALAKTQLGVSRIAERADRLGVSSADAPEFCRKAQLVIGPNNKIIAFEVQVPPGENLDINDVLERADQFEFTSDKDKQSQEVRFAARTRDGKILMEYQMKGRQSILSRVSYYY